MLQPALKKKKGVYNRGVVQNVTSCCGEEHNEPRLCGTDIQKHILLASITHTHALDGNKKGYKRRGNYLICHMGSAWPSQVILGQTKTAGSVSDLITNTHSDVLSSTCTCPCTRSHTHSHGRYNVGQGFWEYSTLDLQSASARRRKLRRSRPGLAECIMGYVDTCMLYPAWAQCLTVQQDDRTRPSQPAERDRKNAHVSSFKVKTMFYMHTRPKHTHPLGLPLLIPLVPQRQRPCPAVVVWNSLSS